MDAGHASLVLKPGDDRGLARSRPVLQGFHQLVHDDVGVATLHGGGDVVTDVGAEHRVADLPKRAGVENEDVFYYLTVYNENQLQPAAPEHLSREELEDGILRGLYRMRPSGRRFGTRAQLFGSGSILPEVLRAQEILEAYRVAADVWSVTSYKALYRDALDVDRRNRLREPGAEPEAPYVARALEGAEGPFVAASDYLKALPDMLARYLPRGMVALGTDGFGRSEAREELRDFFEVDAAHIAHATLRALADEGAIDAETLRTAASDLGIDPNKPNPHHA